jgi:hypothetical protein
MGGERHHALEPTPHRGPPPGFLHAHPRSPPTLSLPLDSPSTVFLGQPRETMDTFMGSSMAGGAIGEGAGLVGAAGPPPKPLPAAGGGRQRADDGCRAGRAGPCTAPVARPAARTRRRWPRRWPVGLACGWRWRGAPAWRCVWGCARENGRMVCAVNQPRPLHAFPHSFDQRVCPRLATKPCIRDCILRQALSTPGDTHAHTHTHTHVPFRASLLCFHFLLGLVRADAPRCRPPGGHGRGRGRGDL